MKLVILAGGSGTRLWPVSRKDTPKQVKPIIGDQTLLKKTYERLRLGFAAKHIFIATNQRQLELITADMPEVKMRQFIIEPAKRDTAAAIGLAAVYIHKHNPKEVMININSDHYIKKEREFLRIIKLAEEVVKKHPRNGVQIGINPTFPDTGMGYIRMGEQAMELKRTKIFKVDSFVEKPDLKTAMQYVESWEYLWNSGSFVWRVDTLLDLYRRFLPKTFKRLKRIEAAIGTEDETRIIKREFTRIEPISIDYGIIEKAKDLLVIPADIGWADVGNWRTVKEILSKRPKGSVKKGNVVTVDCCDNLVYNYSGKLLAMLGVKGMVVIETEDSVLICPKNKAADVKKVIKKLKNPKLEKYL